MAEGSNVIADAKRMWGQLKASLNSMWRGLLSDGHGKETGKVVEEGVAADGSAVFTIELMSGKKFKLKMTKRLEAKKQEDNVYDLTFLMEDGSQFESNSVREDKVRNEISSFVREHFKDDEEDGDSFAQVTDEAGNDVTLERSQEHVAQQTNSARKLNIKLNRIVGSREDTISLTGIMCSNITAEAALDIVNSVLDDEQFVDGLPEGESSFSIMDEGNTVDVQPTTDAIDLRGAFTEVLKASLQVQDDMMYVYWNLQDPQHDRVRSLVDDRNWTTRYMINTLAELCYEHTGSVLHPQALRADRGLPADMPMDGPVSKDTALGILRNSTQALLDSLECYYCNFPHDVQPTVDGWIRDWKDFVDNRLKRFTETGTLPGPTVKAVDAPAI